MIQRVELQFLESNDKFFVDLFPNELPDFLVLYQHFEQQQAIYKAQSLLNRDVVVRFKNKQLKVRIVAESPLEPAHCPHSHWQTILCQPAQFFDLSQRRHAPQEQQMRVSFWDIV